MKIIFVGTGSGKTSLKRNHSSILIQSDDNNLLIDTGDGISRALLRLNIDFDTINSILFTHYHADHFSGIASLLTQMNLGNRSIPLSIYTYKNLSQPLMDFLNASYLFRESFGFNLEIIEFEINAKQNISKSVSFVPKLNSHINQSEILKHYLKERFVSLSLLLEVELKKILYTSDIGSKDDLFLFANEKINYLISESTHISLNEILSAFNKQNAEKLFITHIDSDLENELFNWHKNLSPSEQEKIKICFDGMTITG